MPVVDFLPFATAGGANVEPQSDYAGDTSTADGFSAGLAQSAKVNKVWRQGNFMAAVLANYIANQTGQDVLDDGDLNDKIALLTQAIVTGAGIRSARIVTSSATLNVLVTDYSIGLNRVSGVAAMTINLPADAQIGQEFVLDDVSNNSFANPYTVQVAGGTINGAATYTCREDGNSWKFKNYGTNIWSLTT